MNHRPDRLDLLVVGLGGALGALLRWGLTEAVPQSIGFPWTIFAVNVAGCLALALLPLAVNVRRIALFSGTGVLGGFTTMSAASEQTRALLADGQGALALSYVLGTLLAAVVAVNVAGLVAGRRARVIP